MSERAVKEGTAGRSWSDAMNAMVACYREGIAISRERQAIPPDALVRSRPRISQYLLLMLLIVTLCISATYWVTRLL